MSLASLSRLNCRCCREVTLHKAGVCIHCDTEHSTERPRSLSITQSQVDARALQMKRARQNAKRKRA